MSKNLWEIFTVACVLIFLWWMLTGCVDTSELEQCLDNEYVCSQQGAELVCVPRRPGDVSTTGS